MELFNKSCPLAFPLSQLRGIKPLPKNWEAGKARGQDLLNNATLNASGPSTNSPQGPPLRSLAEAQRYSGGAD